MRISKILLITAMYVTAGVSSAKAEIFKWQDETTKVSITFPDDWRRVSNQQPNDVITIVAPGENDYAECRLRVKEDRRFVIYPREFADEIQRTSVSKEFWEKYVGEYRSALIYAVGDNAGLGNGFASWADVSFVSPAGAKVQKRGLAYATVYNDTAYVLECSAEASVFQKWYHPFLSVLKSVDMRDEYATTVNGHYRDFQNDGKLRIHGEKDVDLFIY